MSTSTSFADRLRIALANTGAVVELTEDGWITVEGSLKPGRRIEVYVRDASDFDVRFHVPEKQGSPFEQVIAGDLHEAEEVQSTVAQFVADLVAERQILLMDPRLFRGGRRFLAASDVNDSMVRHASWVVSWRGTYDSDAPAA